MMARNATLTFLGTGTSQGVPIIGCGCDVCRSTDPRDKRLRASALVDYAGMRILVDAGPDFRCQMLSQRVSHLDAILITHNHKDHTGGLDDVRSLNYIDKRAAEIFCERRVLEELVREYPYVFSFPKYPGAPEWRMNLICDKPFIVRPNDGDKELVWVHDVGYHYRGPDGSLVPTGNCLEDIVSTAEDVSWSGRLPGALSSKVEDSGAGVLSGPAAPKVEGKGAVIVPIRGFHSKLPVLGFRFGDIAYITDMSLVPEEEFSKLKDLKHLTLNTVGYHKHHSHFSLQETLEIADKVGAERTWLTHLSHSFPTHSRFCEELSSLCAKEGVRSIVQPAFDGLVIK